MGEELFVRLRDCFTAGYTLPQYCIDNGIKKPLFVSEEKFKLFLWEVYVQFCYDKRISAQFSFLDKEATNLSYSVYDTIRPLRTKNFSLELMKDFDKVIILSPKKDEIKSDKAIYLNTLKDYFIRKTYYEIPVLNFLQRYPKVKLIVTKLPLEIKQYEGGAEFEKALPTTQELRDLLLKNQNDKVKTQLDKLGYTNQEVFELVEAPRFIKNPDGTTPLQDKPERLLHTIKDGKMLTAYQPKTYQNKIYFIGSCHFWGINAPFDKTIESYLQKMLNENNLPYCVENEGQHYYGRHQDTFYSLNSLNTAPGDIIFIWVNNSIPQNLPILDMSDVFDPPVDYKGIFCEKRHVNECGYKIMAEKIFKYLTENNFFRYVCFNYPIPPPPHITDMVYLHNSSKAAWKFSSKRYWNLTSRYFRIINFQSARLS